MEKAMKHSNHLESIKTIFLAIFFLCILTQCSGPNDKPAGGEIPDGTAAVDEIQLSKEVKAVLEKKKKLLLDFTTGQELIQLVKRIDNKTKAIPLDEIMARDREWQNADALTDFIKSYLTNDIGQTIFKFQQEHDEFTEIFITDSKGTIIGITNRTSDYYQADEAWWQKTYNKGKGLTYFGGIEYDESSKTESIPIYLALMDPQSQQVLGVIKATLAIAAIKMEL